MASGDSNDLSEKVENMALGDEDTDLDLDSPDGFRTSIKRQINKLLCGSKSSVDENLMRSTGSMRSQSSVSSSDFAENRTALVTAQLKPDPNDWDSDVYDFSHRKRGLAIIINNEDFSSCQDFDDRPGSAYDASALYHSFKRLGFEILLYKDLPAWKIVEVLKAAATYDHENADCFACAILSHGDETLSERERDRLGATVRLDLLFGVDGRAVATKYVIELFSDSACPKLKNKPRLFFLQACRGNSLDSGQDVLVHQPKYTTGVRPAHHRRDGQDGGDRAVTVFESQTGSADASASGGGVDGEEDHPDQSTHQGSSVDPPHYHQQHVDSTDAKTMSEEDFLEEEEQSGAQSGGDSANVQKEETKENTVQGEALNALLSYSAGGDSMDAQWGRLKDVPVSPAPLFQDFMVMYATPPGYFAWRRTTGAWFVQSLCKVLDSDLVRHRSLVRALAVVSRLVAQNYESQNPRKPSMHQKKTVPVLESMLVKDIFFKFKP